MEVRALLNQPFRIHVLLIDKLKRGLWLIHSSILAAASRTDFYTMDTMEVPQGTGSGFVWDTKGHIVTNFHVIRGASDIKVALIDSSVYPAKVCLAAASILISGMSPWIPHGNCLSLIS